MKNDKKEKAATGNAQRVVTPPFRVSYPHLFKAKAIKEGDKANYSVTMLFKKTDDLSGIKAAIRAAKIEKYGPNKTKWPKNLQSPVRDGDDDPAFQGKKGYEGCYAIKAISNENVKPGLVDLEGEDILDQGEFYAGCYARAYVFARVWEYMGKCGVHFIVDHVQKLKEGKPLSDRKSAKEVFGAAAIEDLGDDDEESNDSSDDSEDDDDTENF